MSTSNVSQNSALVHLWVPDIDPAKGGIQTFSAFMAKALEQLGLRYRVFSLNSTLTREASRRGHFCFRHWPPRLRPFAFTYTALTQSLLHPPALIICSHLHLATPALIPHFVRSIPFWVVAHGIEAWELTSPNCRYALAKAARILAVSGYTRARLLSHKFLDKHHIAVLPNTFDQEKFRIGPKPTYLLQRYNLDATTPVLFTLGRISSLEQYKGHETVLHAVKSLISFKPDMRYVIGGSGDDVPRIRQLIKQLGLQKHVILTGFISDAEICDHYNLCDLFVMPSTGEGFGVVYLEALACGKPVVAGCRDGSVDALMNGELGFLVEPDDVEQIVEKVHEVLEGSHSNPLLRNPTALRQRVIDEFGPRVFQQGLAKHLSDFLPPAFTGGYRTSSSSSGFARS
jgi:glycosyltransferase involved in cell wall biosynthesis